MFSLHQCAALTLDFELEKVTYLDSFLPSIFERMMFSRCCS